MSKSSVVAVEKLFLGTFANDLLGSQDIFYPQILAVWEETGLFQQAHGIYRQLTTFAPAVSPNPPTVIRTLVDSGPRDRIRNLVYLSAQLE
jgi:hypothetical protein